MIPLVEGTADGDLETERLKIAWGDHAHRGRHAVAVVRGSLAPDESQSEPEPNVGLAPDREFDTCPGRGGSERYTRLILGDS